MNIDKKFFSLQLLNRVSLDQLDDLIDGEEIRRETEGGVNFFIVVDHSEVSRFCFPFGLPAPFSKDNDDISHIDYISEWETTLVNIFSKKVFFLDQHFDELRNLIYKVNQIINDKKSKDILLNEIINRSDNLEGSKDLTKYVEENFQLLLHYALELIGSGVNRLNDLLDPEKNNLIIQHNKNLNEPYKYIAEVLIGAKPTERSDKLFNQFKDELQLDERKEKNLKVDFQVLDRIQKANEILEIEYQRSLKKNIKDQPRNIILFLSSATLLWRLVKQGKFMETMPMIAGKRYNFFRTIDQSFIYTLSISKARRSTEDYSITYDKDRYEFLNKLKLLKEHGWKKVLVQPDYYEELAIKPIISDFEASYNSLIQQIKFEGFVPNASAFTSILNKQLSEIGNLEVDKALADILVSAYELIRNHIGRENSEKKLELLIKLTARSKYIHKFERGLSSLQKSYAQINYVPPRGDDYVIGSAQHLPILLFYNTNKYSPIIDTILSLFVRLELGRASIKSVFEALDRLNTEYSKTRTIRSNQFDLESFKEEHEANLVSLLCYFLFQRDEVINNPELDIINLSNDFIDELDDQQKNIDVSFFKENDLNNEFNRYKCNYLYVICWAARRCRDFDTVKVKAEIGITLTNKQDLRFYQAKCLFYYNIFEKQRDVIKNDYLLIKALYNGEKALQLFDCAYTKEFQNKSFDFIYYSQQSVLNTIVYLSILIGEAEIGNNQTLYINKADIYLKKLIDSLGDNMNSFPEYIHTQAIFLLIKSKVYLERKIISLGKYCEDLELAYSLLVTAREKVNIMDKVFLKRHYDDRLAEIHSLLVYKSEK